jgi:hypothetical protein
MVKIEIQDPEKALLILDRLTPREWGTQSPSNTVVYAWKEKIREQIELAMIEEAQSDDVWVHLDNTGLSMDLSINHQGKIKNNVTDKVYTAKFNERFMKELVTFPDNQGLDVHLDHKAFVKEYFGKEI